jgi:hypothetical protein
VKTIQDRKSIRVHTFVFVVTLIFLLSSMIGTTVWAKPNKPEKPEKPPPDLEPANFLIWIGRESGVHEIRLNPPDDYLYVENEVGGYWLPPPPKGKAPREGWGVGLGPEGEGDDCGKYIINDAELADIMTAKGFDSALAAYRFNIFHSAEPNPRTGEGDYWHISIQWDVGTWVYPNPPPDVIPRFLLLSGNTNMNPVWEGVYDETADTWTVTFDTAEFELHENTTEPDDPDTGSVLNKLWDGHLSFTVEIQRILPN